MRVMTFNVLFGGEERMDGIREVVVRARPDVVVLQECVGWIEDGGARLAAIASAMGAHERGVVQGASNERPSGLRYHVCVASRVPIARHAVHTDGFAHCAVEATLEDGLVVVGTHLISGSEEQRLAEASRLHQLVPPDAVRSGRFVLAGDLNSLVRHDPYPPDLDARFQRAGITKYGSPPRFEVMDRLLGAGWADPLQGNPRWVTAVRGPEHARVDTRTDYVLVSPALAPRVAAAEVIDVGSTSDHHAVVVELG